MTPHDHLIGQRVWFPVEWEEAELDSILEGANGEVIAYVLRRDDGTLVAIDSQMRQFDGYQE